MTLIEWLVIVGVSVFSGVLLIATFVEWRTRLKFKRAEEQKIRAEVLAHENAKAELAADFARRKREFQELRESNRRQLGA